jgi:preprotein translocase subunit YajC
MNLAGIFGMLAMGAPPAGMERDSRAMFGQQMMMIVLMVVVMYVVMIRPQQKKSREHAELLKSVKSGDKVVTSGGIMGVVLTVKDKSLTLRSGDTKLEVLKSAVSEITEKAGATAAS